MIERRMLLVLAAACLLGGCRGHAGTVSPESPQVLRRRNPIPLRVGVFFDRSTLEAKVEWEAFAGYVDENEIFENTAVTQVRMGQGLKSYSLAHIGSAFESARRLPEGAGPSGLDFVITVILLDCRLQPEGTSWLKIRCTVRNLEGAEVHSDSISSILDSESMPEPTAQALLADAARQLVSALERSWRRWDPELIPGKESTRYAHGR